MAFKKVPGGFAGGKPSYRGTLKGDYLKGVLEFLSNAEEADLSVSVSLFKNPEEQGKPGIRITLSAKNGETWEKGPSFGLFKNDGEGVRKDLHPKDRKPNPFKKKEPEQPAPDGEDIPF